MSEPVVVADCPFSNPECSDISHWRRATRRELFEALFDEEGFWPDWAAAALERDGWSGESLLDDLERAVPDE